MLPNISICYHELCPCHVVTWSCAFVGFVISEQILICGYISLCQTLLQMVILLPFLIAARHLRFDISQVDILI